MGEEKVVNENVENKEAIGLKPQLKSVLTLKVILIVFTALVLGYYLLTYFSMIFPDIGNTEYGLALAVWLIVFVLIIGSACSLVALLLGIAGLIISIKGKGRKNRKGNIVVFSIFMALPLLMELIAIIAISI